MKSHVLAFFAAGGLAALMLAAACNTGAGTTITSTTPMAVTSATSPAITTAASATTIVTTTTAAAITTTTRPATTAVNTPVVSKVDIQSSGFSPITLTIKVGATVTWTNNDSKPHTTTGLGGVWDSGSLAPGQSYSRTFSQAGSYPYYSGLDPDMAGTIMVQ